MTKLIKNINMQKFLIIFLMCQPIIDLITSLSVRFFGSFATIGVLVKGMFIAFLILYTFVKYKFKDRKASTIFLIIFMLYEMGYIIVNLIFKSNLILASEIKSSIKTFFAPLVIILLYDILKNERFNFKSRHLSYIIIQYVFLIILAAITGTSFDTYLGNKQGMMGWFFAGNDIGAILISLFPILYFYAIKKSSLFIYVCVFIVAYIVFGIGTKVPVLGIILILLLFMVLSILNYNFKKNKHKLRKNLILTTTLLVFIICLIPNSAFFNNLKIQYDSISSTKEEIDGTNVLDQMVFSGRTEFKEAALKRYNKSNLSVKLFGMGFVDKNNMPYKLVERDHYDLIFNQGIVGTLVYFSVFIYLLILVFKLIFKNKLLELFKMNIESYAVSVAILIAISFYSGHVLLNPTVSIYFCTIFISLYFRVCNLYNPQKREKNNKVTIMALHLKPGGIEKFISTTSKFLSNKYKIEIVSVYEYDKSMTIDIDKKVKVKYLLDKKYVPNKEKLKKHIKDKKILLVLKEVFRALKILILKNYKMTEYIKNCDSEIIISTRSEHNSILSEYAKSNILKIATEHNYYNEKYSKKVVNSCSEINCFVVSTDDQKEYYEKLFLGTGTKVYKIPFALENISKESSKLDNYNLISVGRLSKEKGYSDMLDIFKKLETKDSKFNLKIIGYGIEEDNLKNKIKKLNLEDKVTLCGKKNSKEIQEELLNSSLYLMTSYTESFGIVLIEAMSCGVPCIIFDDAKGALELIENEHNGYIIDNRNFDKYVDTILYTFKNKKLLKQLGKNSKEFSNNFKINNVRNEWLKVLEEN